LSVSNNLDGSNLTLTGSASLADKNAGSQAILVLPSRVRSATGNTGSNAALTIMVNMGTAPANGNTMIAVISTRGTSANRVSGITQTGATWSRAAQTVGTAGTTTEIWYAPNVSSAAAAVSITQANLRSAAVVMEYSGVLAVSPLDQTANTTGSSTAAVTGTTPTTTQANELWIGGIGYNSSTPTLGTPNNSFVSVANAQSTNTTAGNNAKVYALERIVTATGTANSGGTLTASAQWSGAIATFKATSTLGLAGTAAGNYTLTGATGSATISPKELTLAGTTTVTGKTYDGTVTATLTGGALQAAEAAGTGTTTDGIPYSGDAVTLVSSGTFDTKDAGTGKVVTSTSTLGGTNAGNYSLVKPTGLTGTITPKALTLTGTTTVTGKPYDGLVAASLTGGALQAPEASGTGTTIDGKPYSGDAVNLTLSGTFNTKDVANGKAVTSTSTLSGAHAGNYALTHPTGLTGAITPAALTITANNQSKTYGQVVTFGSGATQFTSNGLQNGEAIGSVTLACGGGGAAAAVAGSPYAITLGAATGGTFSAGNYTIGYAPGALTVNPADQTIAFGALAAMTYGDAPFGLTASASSGLAVSYVSSDPTVARVSGNTVTLLKAGGTTLTASQAGDANHNAAPPVPQALTINPGVPTTYETWANDPAQGLTDGVNNGTMDDPDHDGISNLLEFALGGEPMVPSSAILPKLTLADGIWVFEYDRSDHSKSSTTQVVEYGGDLTGWTAVTIPEATDGNVTVTPGTTSDHVKVTIPNPGTKVFFRLKVSE
jgi:hypothetical protein